MKRNSVCSGVTVKNCGLGRAHNYLYIHLPDGAFSILSFWMAVILWP